MGSSPLASTRVDPTMAMMASAPVSEASLPAPTVLAPAGHASLPTRYRILTFSAGFLLGQASLILIAIAFLRYVVFEDPKVALREAGKRKKKRLRSSASKRQRSKAPLFSATAAIPPSDAVLLSKTGYDLSTHSAESADWLNVLLAQAVAAYRSMIVDGLGGDEQDAELEGRGAKGFVEDALNSNRAEGETIVALDYINVTEFELGQEYPIFSNARVRPSNESGKVRIEIDIDYSDHVSLGIETKVLVNFPKPKFAIIPVSLALALVRFSATLTLEIPSAAPGTPSGEHKPLSANRQASLSASLHPDFILELASTSLIGSRAKLQDIPKVEQLIVGRIRSWVIENLVWPRVRTVRLPSVRKRAKSLSPEGDERGYMDDEALDPRSEGDTPIEDADDFDDARSGTTSLGVTSGPRSGRRRASSGGSSSVLHNPAIRIQTSSTNNLRQGTKGPQAQGYTSSVDPLDTESHLGQDMHHRSKQRRRSSLSSTSIAGASDRMTSATSSLAVHGVSAPTTANGSSLLSMSAGPSAKASGHGSRMNSRRHSRAGSIDQYDYNGGSLEHGGGAFSRYGTPHYSPGLGLGLGRSSFTSSSSAADRAAGYRSTPITPTHPLSRSNSNLSISSLWSLNSGTVTGFFDAETPKWEQAARKAARERSQSQSSRGSVAGKGASRKVSPTFEPARLASRVDEEPEADDGSGSEHGR